MRFGDPEHCTLGVVVDLGLISSLSAGQADLLQRRVKSGKEINKMNKQFLEAEE